MFDKLFENIHSTDAAIVAIIYFLVRIVENENIAPVLVEKVIWALKIL